MNTIDPSRDFEPFPDFIARLEAGASDPASPSEFRRQCALTVDHYRGKRFVATYSTPAGVVDCFRADSQPGAGATDQPEPPEFTGLAVNRPAQTPTTAATRCPPGCYPELRRAPGDREVERRAAANKVAPPSIG